MQLLNGHSPHAARVFDMLRLIQDDKAKVHILQQIDIPANQRIGSNEHIHIPGIAHMGNL